MSFVADRYSIRYVYKDTKDEIHVDIKVLTLHTYSDFLREKAKISREVEKLKGTIISITYKVYDGHGDY